jgi:hypothetical protein
MASFVDRMVGAAKLDIHIYEEVERDRSATVQALAVVAMSSVAAGIAHSGRRGGLLYGVAAALVGWIIWAALTYFIGTKLLPEPGTRADIGELLRTIGFASSPGILMVFAIIPVLGWLVSVVIALWMLATFVVAVRQALDYTSTLRAVGVCIIGWIGYAIMSAFLGFFLRF